MNLGETIKALRDEKRLSMRGLAKAVDVTPMHVSNIEKRFTTGSSELIAKIARVLETDVDSLLHMADRVDPEVVEGIQQNPQAVPSFLRSAKDLSADDWEKMRSYLGLGTVGNDADGCMQDVHWFSGTIGYFPTYTLGALAAAQLFKSATQALDALPVLISRGDFEGLVGWLRQNVHSQGRMWATGPLIEKVTGEPLSAEPFKAHLVARYLD